MAGASYNKVILVGRLTKDPELKYTPSGAQLAKFGLAVNRVRSKNDETDFFNIVAWQKLAEICGQYLRKGKLVLIEGEIQTRTYETQEGQKRKVFEIVARNMQMLESRKAAAEYDAGRPNQQQSMPMSPPKVQELDIDEVDVDEFDAEDMPF
ncbi:MAG: single-stranded DNA-binding protein [Candidatus Eremiobacteraeota bacterium]|nr:single-stranded DNA-binding protein [Candidatus Eremiobacteraeota bacterium]